MALSTFSDLKDAVADWLNKSSLAGIGDRAEEFIALFEAQANRELYTREMTATMRVTISAEEMALPCDFAGVRSFRLEGAPTRPLAYAKPEELDESFGTGKPNRYTVTDRIIFDPVPDGEYEARLRYRKRIPALSDTCKTNWLLKRHPDAYLYGALSQAIVYFRDEDRAAIDRRYAAALDAIAQDDKRTAYPSSLNSNVKGF